MVQYSFLLKIEDDTITTVFECGIDFQNCLDKLDHRITNVCKFKSYLILSCQLAG